MKKWSNNICRVGQGDEHTWVTGPCCIILRTWCVFGKNVLFDLCDLGWPLTRSRVIWHMRAGSMNIVTKFHWNRSKHLEDTLGYMVDRRRRRLETFVSASRHWYTGEFSTMSVIVFVDAEMKLNLPIWELWSFRRLVHIRPLVWSCI